MDKQQLIPRGGGRDYDYAQDHCYVKLASQEMNGGLCMVEDELKPGFKLGRHHHKQMTEVFYVLDGVIKFVFDDETVHLTRGDTLTIPPNVWHAAECEDGGRMLTIFKNGRFDEFLERLSGMNNQQFADAALMKSLSEEFDTFEENAA